MIAVLKKDPFLLLIVGTAALGFAVPVTGAAASTVDVVTKVAIFLLFLGYGARLSSRQALDGLQHWRLHLTILACTFGVFPLLGLAISGLGTLGVNSVVVLGLMFVSIVPSTVQSSITFTSIAGGNIAGAIVSATASNVLGVVLTPVLGMLLLPAADGVRINLGTIASVALQLLLPFVLGQFLRRWIGDLVERHRAQLKIFDQIVVCLVVFGAFPQFRVKIGRAHV